MKKLISLILALVMVLSLSVTAFALEAGDTLYIDAGEYADEVHAATFRTAGGSQLGTSTLVHVEGTIYKCEYIECAYVRVIDAGGVILGIGSDGSVIGAAAPTGDNNLLDLTTGEWSVYDTSNDPTAGAVGLKPGDTIYVKTSAENVTEVLFKAYSSTTLVGDVTMTATETAGVYSATILENTVQFHVKVNGTQVTDSFVPLSTATGNCYDVDAAAWTTYTPAASGSDMTINGGDSANVTGTYVAGQEAQTIYSVDISWGDMKFTYTGASADVWNPGDHSTTPGAAAAWTVDNEGGNQVTVTNHSNAAIAATVTYASLDAYSAITGTVTGGEMELASAVGTEYASAPNGTASLTLDGELPSDHTTGAQIGTITVAITDTFFIIDNEIYLFEAGMTWAEWVESDYNTDGAYSVGDSGDGVIVPTNGSGYLIGGMTLSTVNPSHTIEAGGVYQVTGGTSVL